MPFVTIRIVKQAIAADPEGKKAAIGRAVTKAIQEQTGLPETDIWTVFEEVEARNWYLGSKDVETLRFKK